jgi:hypothetical protein
MEMLQTDLKRLGEWAAENEVINNPAKSKAVCFTRARVTELLNYSLRDIVIPDESSCKYLGITVRKDLSWVDQVNFTVKKKPEKHFILKCIFLKREIVTLNFSLHITSGSDSRIWGRVLFAHHRNYSN